MIDMTVKKEVSGDVVKRLVVLMGQQEDYWSEGMGLAVAEAEVLRIVGLVEIEHMMDTVYRVSVVESFDMVAA